jgi:hypothetical protein
MINMVVIFESDVLASGSICSWFLNLILNTFLKCQEILTRNLTRASLGILCAHKVVSWKNLTFFVSCVKKTKCGVTKGCLCDFLFVFLHKTQKNQFFHETWCVHIECRDVSAHFLFTFFFRFFKMFLSVAHAPLCQVEFPPSFHKIIVEHNQNSLLNKDKIEIEV